MKNLIQDLKHTKYGLEGVMDFPLFQTEINVFIKHEDDLDYAQKCADYLCNMPQEILLRLCKYIIRYCEDNRKCLEFEDILIPENITGTKILEYIVPNVLIVEKPDDSSVIGFHVECSCDWESEHGLEFTIKDEKILYVGPFDEMPAWNKGRLDYVGFYNSDNTVVMNYADNEN